MIPGRAHAVDLFGYRNEQGLVRACRVLAQTLQRVADGDLALAWEPRDQRPRGMCDEDVHQPCQQGDG